MTLLIFRIAVVHMLGKTQSVTASTSETFANEIGKFVGQRQGSSGVADNADELPLWPLVGKVQIYCNSPVLASGATLVDLPGVADSNSARSSIAQEYMKNASFVWIVAPIHRAIDEKAAQGIFYPLAWDQR